MPKMKTNSGAKKRFKLTATGKVKRNHAFHSHILTKKSKTQKKRLVKSTILNKAEVKRVKAMLGIN
ncbi:MAG: 50S ribosomal protein L35 [Bacteroidetes bacterium]|nr:50S ribosomal protein L35 [Bacteroidota bacterium]